MKLYHSPGACSLGIRILLELTGAPYETAIVSLARGEQRKPEYLALNPKGKVPALLRPDGSLLTEYPVISLWIGRNFPAAGLLPAGPDGEYRALELVDYVVSSLHMRGSTLAMRPAKFAPDDPAMQEVLRRHGQEAVRDGFARLAERLGQADWFFDRPGIADAAVFYLLDWRAQIGVEPPPALEAFHARMAALPEVQRALGR